MDTVYVTFEVEVRDAEHYYNTAQTGTAKMVVHVPRSILESLDPGGLFLATLKAALAEFDANAKGAEEDDA